MVERTSEMVMEELRRARHVEAEASTVVRRLAAELWAMGIPQVQIAAAVDRSQAAVSRWMRQPPATPEVSVVDLRPRESARGMPSRARLERMDLDLLAEMMRAAVGDAVVAMKRSGQPEERINDLARRGRAARADDVQGQIDLILEAREIRKQAELGDVPR